MNQTTTTLPPKGEGPGHGVVTSYEDVVGLVITVARRFQRRYGGDLDDLIQEGGLGYLRARRNFNTTRPIKFSSWVGREAWYAMHKARKRALRVKERPEQAAVVKTPSRRGGVVKKLLIELSSDAVTVLKVALELPLEAQNPTVGPRTIADALRGLGWCAVQITEALREVREALR